MGKQDLTRKRMFHLVTTTWNPVTGCLHDCKYCWARHLVEKRLSKTLEKYRDGFVPKIHEHEFNEKKLREKFKPGGFVFVSDMGDLFGDWVPGKWIKRVIDTITRYPDTTFLFLTKNPKRYYEFIDIMPENVVLGVTIETNYDFLAQQVSDAPPPSMRFREFVYLEWSRKLVSIEPILEFDVDTMLDWMVILQPKIIYVGYDNYKQRLPEPSLSKTQVLIERLRKDLADKTEVIEKTLRKAWWET